MQTITPATVDRIRAFARPAVDAGSIPRDEFNAAIAALRAASGNTGTAPTHTLLTFGAAAARLACGPKTIGRLVRAGRLRSVKLAGNSPRSIRVVAADVDAFGGGPAHE